MSNLQLAFINGIQCLVSKDKTAPVERATEKGYTNHYYVRHADDNFSAPATVELNPVCVNFWGHAFFPENSPLLNDNWSYQEIEDFERAAKCPECGEEYSNDGDGHDYDAIFEHGKCTGCLGECPYCKPCEECGEDMLNGEEIVVDGKLLCCCCAEVTP